MAPPLAATGKAGKDAHSEETSSLGARAFGVLANYVAAEVADENERLGRMSPVVDFLDRVELRFDGGSIGFEGAGDVFLAEDGRLTFRGAAASAPYAYMGIHICRPDYADAGPNGPFSLSGLWRRSAEAGRLCGCVLDGDWMHVGDPQARDAAEARLAGG